MLTFPLLAGLAVVALAGSGSSAQAAGACLDLPLVFEDATVTGCPDDAELARLMKAPMSVGRVSQGKHLGVALADPMDAGNVQYVNTCSAFERATGAGWTAVNKAERRAGGYMRVACGTLRALRASAPAAKSRIEQEQVGIETLSLLPADVLSSSDDAVMRELAAKQADGVTVAEMAAIGEVLTRASDPEVVQLAYRGTASTFREVAHGDFDGDGWADVLVFSQNAATQGSARWYELFALSYAEGDTVFSRFEPVALPPL